MSGTAKQEAEKSNSDVSGTIPSAWQQRYPLYVEGAKYTANRDKLQIQLGLRIPCVVTTGSNSGASACEEVVPQMTGRIMCYRDLLVVIDGGEVIDGCDCASIWGWSGAECSQFRATSYIVTLMGAMLQLIFLAVLARGILLWGRLRQKNRGGGESQSTETDDHSRRNNCNNSGRGANRPNREELQLTSSARAAQPRPTLPQSSRDPHLRTKKLNAMQTICLFVSSSAIALNVYAPRVWLTPLVIRDERTTGVLRTMPLALGISLALVAILNLCFMWLELEHRMSSSSAFNQTPATNIDSSRCAVAVAGGTLLAVVTGCQVSELYGTGQQRSLVIFQGVLLLAAMLACALLASRGSRKLAALIKEVRLANLHAFEGTGTSEVDFSSMSDLAAGQSPRDRETETANDKKKRWRSQHRNNDDIDTSTDGEGSWMSGRKGSSYSSASASLWLLEQRTSATGRRLVGGILFTFCNYLAWAMIAANLHDIVRAEVSIDSLLYVAMIAAGLVLHVVLSYVETQSGYPPLMLLSWPRALVRCCSNCYSWLQTLVSRRRKSSPDDEDNRKASTTPSTVSI